MTDNDPLGIGGDIAYSDPLGIGGDIGYGSSSPSPYYGQRGSFMDIISGLTRGTASALDLIGGGLQVAGIDEAGEKFRDTGKWLGNTELAKADVDRQLGREGFLKRNIVSAAESLPAMAAPIVAGVATSAVAGPAAGTVVGSLTMAEIFAGGTYQLSYEEAKAQGLSEEESHEVGMYNSVLELGSEALGTGAMMLTFNPGIKVATKAGLKSVLKKGLVSQRQIVEESVKVLGGKVAAAKVLGAPSIEAGTEVLNEIGQRYVAEDYGMERADANLWDVATVGFMLSGPTSVLGANVAKQETQDKIRSNLTKGLNSENKDQSEFTSNEIYKAVQAVDPEMAESWLGYYKMGGRDLDVPLSQINEDYLKKQSINTEMDKLIAETPSSEVPSTLLDGQAPSDVLSEEITQVAEINAETPLERDVAGEVTSRITPADTGRIEAPVDQVIDTELTVNQKIGQALSEVGTADNTVRSGQAQAIEQGMPTGADISRPAPFVPETAQDRFNDYWINKANRESYTPEQVEEVVETTSKEVAKVLPKEKSGDIAELLRSADEGTQEAIVESTKEITEAKTKVTTAPTVAEKAKAIGEVKKKQKELSTIVEYSREELTPATVAEERTKGEAYVSPEVEVEKPKQDIELDETVKEEVVIAKFPNGYSVVKVNNDKYIVKKGTEEVAQYLSGSQKGGALTNAKKAAKTGDTTSGTAVNQKGRKKVSQKVASEKRNRNITVAEKTEVEQWLSDNGYTKTKVSPKLNENGGVIEGEYLETEVLKNDNTSIALAKLLQNGQELTKDNLDKLIKAETKAVTRATEYEQSTKGGGTAVYGSIGEGQGTEGQGLAESATGTEVKSYDDEGKEIGSGDEVVSDKDTDAGDTVVNDVASAPMKPKVLRFHKLTNNGKAYGNWVSEWAGSKYEMKVERGKISLYDGDDIIGTYDDIYEAAESIGATIKDIKGGKSEQQSIVKATKESERELVGGRAEIDAARAKDLEASKKRKKTVVRRRKKADIGTLAKGEKVTKVSEVTTGTEALEVAKLGSRANKALATMVDLAANADVLESIDVIYKEDSPASYYDSDTNTVVLNKNADEGTLIHEVVHALTDERIGKDGVLRRKLKDMISLSKKSLPLEAQAILNKYKTADNMLDNANEIAEEYGQDNLSLAYAHADPHEFLGMAMNSQVVQEHMKSVSLEKPKGKLKTIWDNFINSMQSALGLSPMSYTMLDQVFSTTADAVSSEATIMYHGQSGEYRMPSISLSEVGVHITPEKGLAEYFRDLKKNKGQGLLKEFSITSDKIVYLEDSDTGVWDDNVIEKLYARGKISKEQHNKAYDEIKNIYEKDVSFEETTELSNNVIKGLLQDVGYDVIKYVNRFEYGPDKSLANVVREKNPEITNVAKYIREATDKELQEKYGAKDSYIILDPKAVSGARVMADITSTFDSKVEYAKELGKTGGGKINDFVEKTLQGAADLLESISPKAARLLRDFEFDVNTKTKARLVPVNNWASEVKDKIKGKDLEKYKMMLLNLNSSTVRTKFDEMNKKYDIDYEKVEELLKQLREEGVSRGMLGKVKKGGLYFPKKVKDIDGLMEQLGKGELAKEIEQMLKDRGLEYTPENLSRVYAESLANGSYPAMLGKPNAAKKRTIHKVDEGMEQFYFDPFDTLRYHIVEMTEALEKRKLLGKTNINNIESRLKKAEKPEDIERIQKELEEAKTISEGSIAEWLADEVILNKLDKNKQRQVKDIFMARFNPKGLSRGMAFIKNVTVANALANFGSTITQLADLPVSIHKFGLKNVLKALGNQKLYSQADIDFSGHLKEVEDSTGWSSRLVERVLRFTRFQQLDAFFKGVGLQAALEKAKGMTKEEFIAEYKKTYDAKGEAAELYDMIKSGEKSPEVGRFVFNQLSEVQPLSTSEMPLAYLEGGNARILYALKSYTLKQLNYISKDIVKAGKESPLKAAKVASSYIILMTLANMGTDCIKEQLNGKQCKGLEESAIDNILQMVSLSTYTLGEMKTDPVSALLDSLFMPPTDLVKLPAQDLMNYFDEDKDDTLRSLKLAPMAGRQLWYRGTEEGQAKIEESYEEEEEEEEVDLVTAEYTNSLMIQENATLAKTDEDTMVYPNKAPEDKGGQDIGYGHKITEKESELGTIYGMEFANGLTKDEAKRILEIDIIKHMNLAQAKVGEEVWNELPEAGKELLTDFSFTGTLNKFPKMLEGIRSKDKDIVLKEYQRKFKEGGTMKQMVERNKFSREMIENMEGYWE